MENRSALSGAKNKIQRLAFLQSIIWTTIDREEFGAGSGALTAGH